MNVTYTRKTWMTFLSKGNERKKLNMKSFPFLCCQGFCFVACTVQENSKDRDVNWFNSYSASHDN